ncbi:MAG TPA: hypothetical protein VFC53_13865 [Dehalococcoidia bacterium]|nr:hypothetical protein [Dehalococcoidia bacterium]
MMHERSRKDEAGERDDEYAALEADRAREREVRRQADELAGIDANAPFDERVESASPDEVEVPTPSGDELEEMVRTPPEDEREPRANARDALTRAPDEYQPETAGRSPGDIDIEGDWPEE